MVFRMETLMDTFKMWIGSVSVNLGGRYIGMSEHGLNAAQVGAVA